MNYLERITINPKVMTGKPIIKGTRVPVELVLKKLAQNIDAEEILKNYPHLTKEDIKAAILYAQEILRDEKVYPIKRARA